MRIFSREDNFGENQNVRVFAIEEERYCEKNQYRHSTRPLPERRSPEAEHAFSLYT